jgi:hypothetical protein
MKKPKGPEVVHSFLPILMVLRDLGGSGTTSEVIDKVIERLKSRELET